MTNQGEDSGIPVARERRALSPNRRRWFIALILLAFAATQELVLRLLFPIPELRNFNRVHYSALLKKGNEAPRPLRNASYRFESRPDGFSFIHELNLYGFRDRQWRIERQPGTERVMFVGDSFTEGAGAAEGSTIVDGFRKAAGNARIEAMNLGIQGIGVGHYLTLLGDAVPVFRPDHVVLVLMANDFGNMAMPDPRRLLGRMGKPVRNSVWEPRLLRLLDELNSGGTIATAWKSRPFPFFAPVPDPRNPWSDSAERRRLATVVKPDLAQDMMAGRLNPHLPLGHDAQHYWFPRSSPIGQHLAILRDYLAHHDCRLTVVFFPARNQVTDAYLKFDAMYNPPPIASVTGPEFQRPARDTAAACVALDITFVDLSPKLSEWETAGRRCYWDYDNHPTGETYLKVGRIIFEQLHPSL